MKIKIITILLSFFLSIGLFGQDNSDYNIKQPVGISSINEAATIAEQIVEAAGLQANFMIAEADVPNALAVVHQGKRLVLYNPGFINRLTLATGTKWAAVSVLAHEIGHHLYNRLAGKQNFGLATELEADKFSGYVLENLGAKLEEAQAAMNFLATPYATPTHPARSARISSIASGFRLAGGTVAESGNDIQSNDHIALPSGSILARLEFTSAPGEDYYITKRLNIVKVENEQVSVLGTLRKSTDTAYPFIISDGKQNEFYISERGEIVNTTGRIVGKVKGV